MVREYHPIAALSGTPDACDPHEKGTRISRVPANVCSAHRSRSPRFVGSNAKRHRPLRLIHSLRSKSGRGCSGRGMLDGRAGWAEAAGAARRKAARNETTVWRMGGALCEGDRANA